MFLLQALTPPGNEVILVDGNTRPLTDPELVEYARKEKIDLVGIGAMTRMIAKAYRVADALRAAGFRVVMGGPHVTELPDEALGARAVPGMPMPWRSAKPTKPGRASWPTPRQVN